MTDEVVGRENELSVLQQFLDRPMVGLRAMVLEGEAGIGKSTIWEVGVASARQRGLRVQSSRPAEAERTLPYVVLGDLFADVEARMLEGLEAPRRRAFESALLRAGSDVPVDPRALGVAIHDLLAALTGGGPLFLAIDDDQWLDDSSAATLEFALRRSLQQPVLVLLSRRIGAKAPHGLEAKIGAVDVGRERVGPLSVGSVQVLLRRRLDVALPRPTLLRLHEASGGNPFYALELARARTMDPSRDLTAPFSMPPTLERLVAERVEALDARTRHALLLVAAHGRMPLGLLEAVGVGSDVLEPGQAAHVVVTADSVVSFAHPLLASAIYQGVSSGERRAAHRRLATALADPVERGRHLALAADQPDAVLASDLEAAAAVACVRGIPLAGAELAEHALRLTPSDARDDRHRRAIAAARAHIEAGAGARARAITVDLLRTAAAGSQRAEALVVASELEDPGPALPLLQEALVEAAASPALRADIHGRLATTGRATMGREWGEHHAREVLRSADALDDDLLRGNAMLMDAQDRFERGDPDGLERVERAHTFVYAVEDSDAMRWADSTMGWVLTFATEYGRARVWLEQKLAFWRERDERLRSEFLWLLALTEFWCGRWDLAAEYADQVREISFQYGEVPTDHLSPALIALHRGQIDIARRHSTRALSLARGHILPQHMAILGVCDLWSGQPADALVHLTEADRAADVRGWDEPNIRWWRADLAEALLQVGRVDEADRLMDDWEAATSRVKRGRARAHVVRGRGLIAAARGDISTALDVLERAADLHQVIGDPFNCARALMALGVVRLRARKKRAARDALEAAGAAFEALGAVAWTEAARSERARVGGRVRIEGLSPSELRVAELVAEGRTNREIASALFLGERTVASHLTRIYSKLGIRSRTELARRMPARTSQPADGSNIQTS